MAATVVGLHGFTGAAAAWQEVVAGLPGGLEMHCPELLGHAGGPGEDDSSCGCGFEAEVGRLAAWIDDRCGEGERPYLVGYSLGARLALGLALERPGSLAGVLLIGVHPGLTEPAEREQRARADRLLAAKLEQQGVAAFLDYWQALPMFASQSTVSARALTGQRQWRQRHSAAGLALALRQLSLGMMPSYGERLAELELPVLLMVGERDTKFRRLASEMLPSLSQGTFQVVPAAGHNLILEQPSRVAAAIVEELQKCQT